jgi:hypothetical protein
MAMRLASDVEARHAEAFAPRCHVRENGCVVRYARWRVVGAAFAAAGALALLSRLEIVSTPTLRIDLAVLLIFLISAWYLVVDRRLGLGVLGFLIVLYVVGAVLPLWLAMISLVAGGGLLAAARFTRKAI